MAQSETIKVGDTDFTARELTVKQIKEMLETVSYKHAINSMFESDIPAEGVALACGVSLEDLEVHLPSDLKKIWEAVEKVNPCLAGMVKGTSEMLYLLKQLSETSPAVSAD